MATRLPHVFSRHVPGSGCAEIPQAPGTLLWRTVGASGYRGSGQEKDSELPPTARWEKCLAGSRNHDLKGA